MSVNDGKGRWQVEGEPGIESDAVDVEYRSVCALSEFGYGEEDLRGDRRGNNYVGE